MGTGTFTYIYHKLLSKWKMKIFQSRIWVLYFVYLISRNIKEKSGVKYPGKKTAGKRFQVPVISPFHRGDEIPGQTLGGNSSSNEVSISLGARSRNVLLLVFLGGGVG